MIISRVWPNIPKVDSGKLLENIFVVQMYVEYPLKHCLWLLMQLVTRQLPMLEVIHQIMKLFNIDVVNLTN